jgi:hypothetical protein
VQLAQGRDPSSFRTILHGNAGQSGIYDAWRRLEAWARGAEFQKEHGRK